MTASSSKRVVAVRYAILALALSALFIRSWPGREWAGFVGFTLLGLQMLFEHRRTRNIFGVSMGLGLLFTGATFAPPSVWSAHAPWLDGGVLLPIGGSLLGVGALAWWIRRSDARSVR
jgi:apolipoprotein N-acyltransferase